MVSNDGDGNRNGNGDDYGGDAYAYAPACRVRLRFLRIPTLASSSLSTYTHFLGSLMFY